MLKDLSRQAFVQGQTLKRLHLCCSDLFKAKYIINTI